MKIYKIVDTEIKGEERKASRQYSHNLLTALAAQENKVENTKVMNIKL